MRKTIHLCTGAEHRTLLLEMMWAVAEADGGMKDEEMAALKRAHQVSTPPVTCTLLLAKSMGLCLHVSACAAQPVA